MPFDHFRPWERALLALGLVRRDRYTDRVAAHEGDRIRLDCANAIVGKQLAELERLSRESGRLEARLDSTEELVERLGERPAATADERLLLARLRRHRSATEPWTDEERAAVAEAMSRPGGRLALAELRAWAAGQAEAATACAAGSEARALGYAQGAVQAAAVLEALIFTATASRDPDATPEGEA